MKILVTNGLLAPAVAGFGAMSRLRFASARRAAFAALRRDREEGA